MTAPSRVARPTVGTTSTTSLYVSWSPPASDGGSVITAYHVRYRVGSSGDWSTPLIVGGGGSARGRVITALTPGTSYEVEVVAQNRVGTSRWSLPGTGTTTAVATVPARPARPAASSSSTNTIEVVWSAPADGGSAITDYDVRYRAGRTGAWTLHAHTGTDAMVTVDGLQAGTYHEVQVRAENGVGAGPWSLSASATTGGTAPSAPATVPAQPATPALLAASPTSIAVVWIAPDNGGAAIEDYDVQYRAGDSGPWTSWAHVGTATHTIITGLVETTRYFVQVRAENSVGESLWSSLGSAVETLTFTARDAALVASSGEPTASVAAESAVVPIRDAALTVTSGEPAVSVAAEVAGVTNRDAALTGSSGVPTASVAADIADRDITALGSLATGTVTRVGEITGREDHFTLSPRPDNRATDWYNFTLPRKATSLIISSVSGLDLSGWLYGGTMTTISALADLTRIAYNDDGGTGNNFQISRTNLAAGDYTIAVQKYRRGSTDYRLRIVADILPIVNRAAALTVTTGEPTVSVEAKRSVVVHGDAELSVRTEAPTVEIAAEGAAVVPADAAVVATSGIPRVSVMAERSAAVTHDAAFAAESGQGNTATIVVLATATDLGNPLQSLMDMMRADPVVAHAIGEVEVYGQTMVAITGEIDEEWAKCMPRRLVLVREVGGLPKTERGPLSWPRFDVRCYGADPGGVWDSSELSRLIANRMFAQHNMVTGVVAITLNAGPTSGREMDTGWAYNLRTYDVLQGG